MLYRNELSARNSTCRAIRSPTLISADSFSAMPDSIASAEIRNVLGFRLLRLRPPMSRRIFQILPGLIIFGIALALTIEADLGSNPWTVFSQGVSERSGLSIGVVVMLTGALLLVAFAPLREPIGIGTLLNIAVIGLSIDAALALIPDLHSMAARVVVLGIAPPTVGLASGLYLGAGLGPGPRDGLMTALTRSGLKISTARTIIEMTALGAGWVLGGTAGFGTVYWAVTVGWWIRLFLPPMTIGG